MARGWESKSVESQQADAARSAVEGPPLSPEARVRLDRAAAVRLSLARVRDELTRATRPAHRAMLEQAALSLEADLTALSS